MILVNPVLIGHQKELFWQMIVTRRVRRVTRGQRIEKKAGGERGDLGPPRGLGEEAVGVGFGGLTGKEDKVGDLGAGEEALVAGLVLAFRKEMRQVMVLVVIAISLSRPKTMYP